MKKQNFDSIVESQMKPYDDMAEEKLTVESVRKKKHNSRFWIILVFTFIVIPLLLVINTAVGTADVNTNRLESNSANYDSLTKCEQIIQGVKVNLHEDSNAVRGK